MSDWRFCDPSSLELYSESEKVISTMPEKDISTVMALLISNFTPGSRQRPITYTKILDVLHKTVELETAVEDNPAL